MPPLDELIPDFRKIYESGRFSNFGLFSEDLERRFERFVRMKPELGDVGVSVCNATLGLMIALKSLDLGSGARILVPSFTFPATINAILWNGYIPVFVDIREGTLQMDPMEMTRARVSPNSTHDQVDAVLAVSPFGEDIDFEILKWASERSVPVIVDAASSVGLWGFKPGTYHPTYQPHATVYSMHATKMAPAGEGGMVIAKDFETAEIIRGLSNFGYKPGTKKVEGEGLNAKMSEFNAVIGLHSLAVLKGHHHRQVRLWIEYRKALGNLTLSAPDIKLVGINQFATVLFETEQQRRWFEARLKEAGIETMRYYEPCHHSDIFGRVSETWLKQDVTDSVWNRILCLPAWMNDYDPEFKHILSTIGAMK